MQRDGSVYRFGPFELDSSRRTLTRGADRISISIRGLDVLLVLVANAGELVSKDTLFERAWPGIAVTDNSIVQAVKSIREAIGTQQNGEPYIENRVRRGYRFVAPVTRIDPPRPPIALDVFLSPHRAFIDGRAALETFDRDAVARARRSFDEALRATPNLAEPHIGVANACILAFEASGAHASPDIAALQEGDFHAREACRLDPTCAEAWSTLAFLLYLQGHSRDAGAAARNAIALEPDNWHHHLSLAFVGWGEDRLRAARKLTTLCPGLALAHWLTASVFIARQAFEAAFDTVRAGCAAQDNQPKSSGRFHILGLHLLHGQLLATRGALDEALEELERELLQHHDGHIYARECYSNVWYSIGAIRCRQGERDGAESAFREALRHAPSHMLASVGLRAVCALTPVDNPTWARDDVDAAIAIAAALAVTGQHDQAARVCGDALQTAQPGPDGWTVPIDPLLQATSHQDAWGKTLALLRERAA